MGVSVIMITAPFDQVMKLHWFNMDVELQNYTVITPIPNSFDYCIYIKCIVARTNCNNPSLRITFQINFVPPSNNIILNYDSTPD